MALAVHEINDDRRPSLGSSSPQDDDNDLIDKYFAAIQQQFEVAEQLIDAIEKDQDAINHGNNKATKKLQDELYELAKEFGIPWHHNATDFPDVDSLMDAFVEAMKYAGQDFSTDSKSTRKEIALQWISQMRSGDTSMGDLRKQCNPYLKQIGALNKDITDKEAQLQQIDPKFTDLINTLEALRTGRRKEAEDGTETGKDKTLILHTFTALFQAMRDKCNTDRLEAMISAAKNNSGVSDQDLEKLALESMASQSSEQTVLQTLEDDLLSASDAFVSQRDAARLDKNKHNWGHDGTDAFKHGIIGADRRAKDRAIIQNANKMIDLIASVEKSMSAEAGSIMSAGLYQIGMVLNNLVKEIGQILGGNLSASGKKEKILLAMTMALGAVNRLKAEVAKEKDVLEKMIAEAAQKGSAANIKSITAESAQMEVLRSTAKKMAGFMKNLKIVMTVISFMFASFTGGASLVLMGVLTGLDASGETGKATAKLAQALAKDGCRDAQLVAEVLVGASELALMVGAGAADGEYAAAAEGGATISREAAEIAVREAVVSAENTLQTTAQSMSSIESDAAQKITDAMKLVNLKLSRITMRQSLPNIIRSVVEKTVQKNSEKAAELVIQQVQEEVKLLVQTTDKIALKTADEIADAAVAKARNTTSEIIAKASAKDTAADMAARTAWQSLYVAGSRNIIVDIILDSAKAHGVKKDSSAYQTLEIVANVLQAMIAGLGGYKSMGPQLAAEQMPIWFSRVITGANVIELGATTTLEGSLARVDEKQAGIVRKIAQNQAANQGFQFLLKRLFDEQKLEMNAYIDEENRTSQTSYKMASKLESMEVETDLLRVLQVTV